MDASNPKWKRTARAALKIACDMVDEGMLSPQGAIGMIDPSQLDQLLHPTLDPNADSIVIGRGLPSSPGAVSGRIVFDPKDAGLGWLEVKSNFSSDRDKSRRH